jgi:hypothetical protein
MTDATFIRVDKRRQARRVMASTSAFMKQCQDGRLARASSCKTPFTAAFAMLVCALGCSKTPAVRKPKAATPATASQLPATSKAPAGSEPITSTTPAQSAAVAPRAASKHKPRFTQVDLVRLRTCCKTLDAMGQALGQEGVGFISLASVCDDLPDDGGAPTLQTDDWAQLGLLLSDKRVSSKCRAVMLKLAP